MSELQMVRVVWKDATSMDAWAEAVEVENLELHTIHSVGFLVAEHPDRIVLILSLDTDSGNMSQSVAIPRDWIVGDIEYLKAIRKRVKAVNLDA